jgi:LacI family transcriptional regulator
MAEPKRAGAPTINDVARIAGVSKKTVSRVINASPLMTQATRERVQQVIDDLGYVPNPQARALALRRNFLIGLIHDNPNAQMVLEVQNGILEAIRDTPYALVVRPVDRRSPRMIEDISAFIEQQRLSGVLFLPPISERDELAAVCAQQDCRYVRMGSAMLDDAAHAVASNDREVVGTAVSYLIEQGHRRIGLILGPPGFRSAEERAAGFDEAMQAAGLPLSPALRADGDYRFDSGRAAAERLLDSYPQPTAIFASNDEMAAGAIHAARARNMDVPGQLSVIGFDDTAIASHIWPPLTTVRWPITSMARAAAMRLIDDHQTDAGTLFLSSLIRRGSVAPPRAD